MNKSFEQIDQETQEYLEDKQELVDIWHKYTEARSRPVGRIIFEGMGLYEGFEHFIERALDDPGFDSNS